MHAYIHIHMHTDMLVCVSDLPEVHSPHSPSTPHPSLAHPSRTLYRFTYKRGGAKDELAMFAMPLSCCVQGKKIKNKIKRSGCIPPAAFKVYVCMYVHTYIQNIYTYIHTYC